MKIPERWYFFSLLILVGIVWLWSAWQPGDLQNWITENIAVFFLVPGIVYLTFYIRLSNLSITLLSLFAILHFIGAHYNYSQVGFGFWLEHIFNTSKNVYDRFVHFSFGFLIFYPVREVFLRVADTKGFWRYYLPLDVILSFSALYEIFEWITVSSLDAQTGLLFIGGNDPFDAPKDIAMAALGAVLALLLLALFEAAATNNFRSKIKSGFKINRDMFLAADSFLQRFFTKQPRK